MPPVKKFYVGAVYKPGRFTLNVNVQSIFDLYTNEGCTEGGRFYNLECEAAYRFGTRDKGLNLFVKGENLTGYPLFHQRRIPDAEGDIYGRYRRNFLAWVEKELPEYSYLLEFYVYFLIFVLSLLHQSLFDF